MNTLLSSAKTPIVAFRKKILHPKNAPVQDLFTECDKRHFRLSWPDPSDPALRKRWKVMVTFRPINSKLPAWLYWVFPIYGISTCVPSHINVAAESNLPMTQTSRKDARNRSAATAGCSETCFSILSIVVTLEYADLFTLWLSAARLNVTKKQGSWQSVLFPS